LNREEGKEITSPGGKKKKKKIKRGTCKGGHKGLDGLGGSTSVALKGFFHLGGEAPTTG